MLIALRAVADSGQQVDEQIVRRAVAYIESAQNDDGGFRYQLEAAQQQGRERQRPLRRLWHLAFQKPAQSIAD